MPDSRVGSVSRTDNIQRFNQRMLELESSRAKAADVPERRSVLSWLDFPFASVSVIVVLLSLFSLSMYLGGWTWSSWTYALSLFIVFPLVAIEIKRKAVITGGAAILLVFTVIIDAGLPQYFGYSPSDMSWYDLTAHFLGALVLTIFLWSVLCWTVSPSGPPKENGRRKIAVAVVAILLVSFIFELMEFMTDFFFGWRNFHPGIDTLGDLIFDVAGVITAAFLISRHRVSAIKRPFWHESENPLWV